MRLERIVQNVATVLFVAFALAVTLTPLIEDPVLERVAIVAFVILALVTGAVACGFIPYNLGITWRFGDPDAEEREQRQLLDELAKGSTDPSKWERYMVLEERRRKR